MRTGMTVVAMSVTEDQDLSFTFRVTMSVRSGGRDGVDTKVEAAMAEENLMQDTKVDADKGTVCGPLGTTANWRRTGDRFLGPAGQPPAVAERPEPKASFDISVATAIGIPSL